MQEKAKPVHEVRYGAIKAAIWRNETENGIRYNTTFSRLYKSGEQWETTESFGRDDLLLLSLMVQWSFEWIINQPSATRKDV